MAEEILQKVEDELNCRICLDRYEDPKLLECFHVYCRKCLARLTAEKIPCPECRQETTLPANGVAGLKSAFYINRLLGNIPEDPKKEKQYCSEHCEEELKLYCESCRSFACLKCVTKGGKHHGHDYELLNEALKKYREELQSSLELVSKQMASVIRALSQLDEHRHKVVNQQAMVEAGIDEKYYKTHIASQLHQITERKLKNLTSQKEQLKSTESQLRGCFEFMKKIMETDNCHEVLEVKESLVKKIRELIVPIKPDMGDILFSGALAVRQSTDILLFNGE